MTAAPEPLRLFADDPGPAKDPSRPKTTPPEPQEEALRALARSADRLRQAQERFRHAIQDTRASGHSWRAIGRVAGVPFQTLHHTHRKCLSSSEVTL